MKRVVEQNQTDVVRLQEKSINPVQKKTKCYYIIQGHKVQNEGG